MANTAHPSGVLNEPEPALRILKTGHFAEFLRLISLSSLRASIGSYVHTTVLTLTLSGMGKLNLEALVSS
jgi:hypothetical protein